MRGHSIPTPAESRGGDREQARKSGLDARTKQDRKIPEGTNRNYSGKNNAK